MKLIYSDEMRSADLEAIEKYDIPSRVLMDNAASHIVKKAMEILQGGKSVAIFCGSGNNGGDGMAAAYQLICHGISVTTYFVGSVDKLTEDCIFMIDRLHSIGKDLTYFTFGMELPSDCGLIIDTMLGIGIEYPLRGNVRTAANLMNSANLPIISADVPSGVFADNANIEGVAVKADYTIAFSRAKPCHYVEPACTYCGEVTICDIGVPEDILKALPSHLNLITDDMIKLPKRKELSHKYDYGKLLILGGSVGYTGAVSLCTKAAVRTGAGVVFTGVPKPIYSVTAVKNDEAVIFPLPDDGEGKFSAKESENLENRLVDMSAAVIGVGLGRSKNLVRFVTNTLKNVDYPVVLDADGLFAISHNMEAIRKCMGEIIVTPHEGEFLKLGGFLTGDRVADVKRFAERHQCAIILKGHHTISAFPDGECYVCPYGNAGMAKGGSGDVLSGILGALLCMLPVKMAVITAQYIHAKAGDLASEKFGEYSMTPSDMINCIHEITKYISER